MPNSRLARVLAMPTDADHARLQLDTLFVTDDRGRIVGTREPPPSSPGPAFALVRGRSTCAWAIGATVPDDVAAELARWAADEPPTDVWGEPLRHADRYAAAVGGAWRSGPAFAFPDRLDGPWPTVEVADEGELARHFSGWVPGEIAAGRGPVLAVRRDGWPVSVCCCARRSAVAAEAGVETAPAFRGRGFAPQVVTAWARRVRADGLVPLYSTDWSNRASLAVARKLRLVPYAVDFAVTAEPGARSRADADAKGG